MQEMTALNGEVTKVHHQRVLRDTHLEPRSLPRHHLEAADAVVGEQGDRAVVGVHTASQLSGGQRLGPLGGVVDEPEVVHRLPAGRCQDVVVG